MCPVCFHRPEELFPAPTYHYNPLWRATLPRVLIRGWAVGELVCVSLSSLPGHSSTPIQQWGQKCRVYVLVCWSMDWVAGWLKLGFVQKNIQYSTKKHRNTFYTNKTVPMLCFISIAQIRRWSDNAGVPKVFGQKHQMDVDMEFSAIPSLEHPTL